MTKKIYLNTLKPEEVIKRLKAGEVVKFDKNPSGTVRMIDDVIVTECKNTTLYNDSFVVHSDGLIYFEEEEKFEITETGLYKTRSGCQVYVSSTLGCGVYSIIGVVIGEVDTTWWQRDGRCYQDKIDDYDIVAKWED